MTSCHADQLRSSSRRTSFGPSGNRIPPFSRHHQPLRIRLLRRPHAHFGNNSAAMRGTQASFFETSHQPTKRTSCSWFQKVRIGYDCSPRQSRCLHLPIDGKRHSPPLGKISPPPSRADGPSPLREPNEPERPSPTRASIRLNLRSCRLPLKTSSLRQHAPDACLPAPTQPQASSSIPDDASKPNNRQSPLRRQFKKMSSTLNQPLPHRPGSLHCRSAHKHTLATSILPMSTTSQEKRLQSGSPRPLLQ